MNNHTIWMPLYIGDYLGDTVGLSLAEHGAYLLSMFQYWRKGESLTDRELRGTCGREFDRVSQFYVLVDRRWHHKRIDSELEKSRLKSEQGMVKILAMNKAKKLAKNKKP